jgi:hypothetical protein
MAKLHATNAARESITRGPIVTLLRRSRAIDRRQTGGTRAAMHRAPHP